MLATHIRLSFMVHGEPVRWLRSLGRCPCYDPARGAWDKEHSLCLGSGWLHEEVPLAPDRTHGKYVALISNARTGRRHTGYGQIEDGDLSCSTWPSEIGLAEEDLIVIPSRVATSSETLKRGPGPADRLREAEVAEVLRVYTEAGPLASGVSAEGNRLVFAPGVLAEGVGYSVLYRYVPRWVVLQGSILHRKPDLLGVEMPQVVTLRLWNPNAFDGPAPNAPRGVEDGETALFTDTPRGIPRESF